MSARLRPAVHAFAVEDAGDLQEFRAASTISRARQLAEATGQHFNADRLPQYFTGDLDGPVVLVHLNPKQANAPAPPSGWQTTARTLEEYFDACRHFGARMYGPSSPRTHRSRFDDEQIQFLRPLGVIDFVQGHNGEDRFTNLVPRQATFALLTILPRRRSRVLRFRQAM